MTTRSSSTRGRKLSSSSSSRAAGRGRSIKSRRSRSRDKRKVASSHLDRRIKSRKSSWKPPFEQRSESLGVPRGRRGYQPSTRNRIEISCPWTECRSFFLPRLPARLPLFLFVLQSFPPPPYLKRFLLRSRRNRTFPWTTMNLQPPRLLSNLNLSLSNLNLLSNPLMPDLDSNLHLNPNLLRRKTTSLETNLAYPRSVPRTDQLSLTSFPLEGRPSRRDENLLLSSHSLPFLVSFEPKRKLLHLL